MTRIQELHQNLADHGESRSCLLWQHEIDNHGYGRADANGGRVSVHRVACWAAHGAPTEEKPLALHSCHTRTCYNPQHLRWGSNQENREDRRLDGTWGWKLTEAQVLEIRNTGAAQRHLPQRHPDRTPYRQLAKIYNVGQTTISAIIRGACWHHIEGTES